MSDQGFREVQLSGKQVVFLFMALAVVLVGTFLLGVSVGRRVEPETVNAQATPTATSAPPDPAAPMPPPTATAPGDFRYKETLRGQPVPPTPTPSAKPSPANEPIVQSPKATPTPEAKAAPPAGEAFYVQVNAFTSSDNASKELSGLKAKGITAARMDKSGGHYLVRVGPFDRKEADAMSARLRKLGYTPRVTR